MPQNDHKDSIPIPDPTLRTIEQSLREIANLKELLLTQLAPIKEAGERTANGFVLLSSDRLEQERLVKLQELFNQKIANVDLQIKAADELRRAERSGFSDLLNEMIKGRDVALAAALRAAQELGAQQNTSNNLLANIVQSYQKEALNQQQLLLTSKTDAQGKEIAELRSRLDKGEGVGVGAGSQRTEAREIAAHRLQGSQLNAMVIAIVVSAVISLALHFLP
jgi:hypothetical protein